MTLPQLIRRLPVGNTLGEGVIWDQRTAAFYWTDIEERRFWSWEPEADLVCSYPLRERLGSFALTRRAGVFIGAFETGFARFCPDNDTLCWLGKIQNNTVPLRMRLNDGRTDRSGKFWAGSMHEDALPKGELPAGRFHRLEPDGSARAFLAAVQIPNSICWSPDGRKMYFADSPARTIWSVDYSAEEGPLGEPQIFAKTGEGIFPDGSTIDSQGCLWNAQWGGAQIVRYSPGGETLSILPTPVRQPSCVAFGGKSLNLLCVTSAKIGLDTEGEGDLLVYGASETGLPECITQYAD